MCTDVANLATEAGSLHGEQTAVQVTVQGECIEHGNVGPAHIIKRSTGAQEADGERRVLHDPPQFTAVQHRLIRGMCFGMNVVFEGSRQEELGCSAAQCGALQCDCLCG